MREPGDKHSPRIDHLYIRQVFLIASEFPGTVNGLIPFVRLEVLDTGIMIPVCIPYVYSEPVVRLIVSGTTRGLRCTGILHGSLVLLCLRSRSTWLLPGSCLSRSRSQPSFPRKH